MADNSLGEIIFEINTKDTGFTAGMDKAENRTKAFKDALGDVRQSLVRLSPLKAVPEQISSSMQNLGDATNKAANSSRNFVAATSLNVKSLLTQGTAAKAATLATENLTEANEDYAKSAAAAGAAAGAMGAAQAAAGKKAQAAGKNFFDISDVIKKGFGTATGEVGRFTTGIGHLSKSISDLDSSKLNLTTVWETFDKAVFPSSFSGLKFFESFGKLQQNLAGPNGLKKIISVAMSSYDLFGAFGNFWKNISGSVDNLKKIIPVKTGVSKTKKDLQEVDSKPTQANSPPTTEAAFQAKAEGENIAKFFTDGLEQGLKNNLRRIRATTYQFVKNGMVGGANEGLDINSPSGEGKKIGFFFIEGIIVGAKNTIGAAKARISAAVKGIADTAQTVANQNKVEIPVEVENNKGNTPNPTPSRLSGVQGDIAAVKNLFNLLAVASGKASVVVKPALEMVEGAVNAVSFALKQIPTRYYVYGAIAAGLMAIFSAAVLAAKKVEELSQSLLKASLASTFKVSGIESTIQNFKDLVDFGENVVKKVTDIRSVIKYATIGVTGFALGIGALAGAASALSQLQNVLVGIGVTWNVLDEKVRFVDSAMQDVRLELASLAGSGAPALDMLDNLSQDMRVFGKEGQEQLQQVGQIFSQIAADGQISAESVQALSAQGVPALQSLSAAFGVSTDQMSQMLSDGVVPLSEGMAVLSKATEEYYSGLAEKQSKTFLGIIDSLKTSSKTSLKDATFGLFEALKTELGRLAAFVKTDKAGQFFGLIEKQANQLAAALPSVSDGLIKIYNFVFDNTEKFAALGQGLSTVTMGWLAPIGSGFKILGENIMSIQIGTEGYTNWIMQATEVTTAFGNGIAIVVTLMASFVGGAGAGFSSVLVDISTELNHAALEGKAFTEFLRGISTNASAMGKEIGQAAGSVLGFWVAVGKTLDRASELAGGFNIVKTIMDSIEQTFDRLANAVRSNGSEVSTMLGSMMVLAKTLISVFTTLMNFVSSFIENNMAGFTGFITAFVKAVTAGITWVISAFNALRPALDNIGATFLVLGTIIFDIARIMIDSSRGAFTILGTVLSALSFVLIPVKLAFQVLAEPIKLVAWASSNLLVPALILAILQFNGFFAASGKAAVGMGAFGLAVKGAALSVMSFLTNFGPMLLFAAGLGAALTAVTLVVQAVGNAIRISNEPVKTGTELIKQNAARTEEFKNTILGAINSVDTYSIALSRVKQSYGDLEKEISKSQQALSKVDTYFSTMTEETQALWKEYKTLYEQKAKGNDLTGEETARLAELEAAFKGRNDGIADTIKLYEQEYEIMLKKQKLEIEQLERTNKMDKALKDVVKAQAKVTLLKEYQWNQMANSQVSKADDPLKKAEEDVKKYSEIAKKAGATEEDIKKATEGINKAIKDGLFNNIIPMFQSEMGQRISASISKGLENGQLDLNKDFVGIIADLFEAGGVTGTPMARSEAEKLAKEFAGAFDGSLGDAIDKSLEKGDKAGTAKIAAKSKERDAAEKEAQKKKSEAEAKALKERKEKQAKALEEQRKAYEDWVRQITELFGNMKAPSGFLDEMRKTSEEVKNMMIQMRVDRQINGRDGRGDAMKVGDRNFAEQLAPEKTATRDPFGGSWTEFFNAAPSLLSNFNKKVGEVFKEVTDKAGVVAQRMKTIVEVTPEGIKYKEVVEETVYNLNELAEAAEKAGAENFKLSKSTYDVKGTTDAYIDSLKEEAAALGAAKQAKSELDKAIQAGREKVELEKFFKFQKMSADAWQKELKTVKDLSEAFARQKKAREEALAIKKLKELKENITKTNQEYSKLGKITSENLDEAEAILGELDNQVSAIEEQIVLLQERALYDTEHRESLLAELGMLEQQLQNLEQQKAQLKEKTDKVKEQQKAQDKAEEAQKKAEEARQKQIDAMNKQISQQEYLNSLIERERRNRNYGFDDQIKKIEKTMKPLQRQIEDTQFQFKPRIEGAEAAVEKAQRIYDSAAKSFDLQAKAIEQRYTDLINPLNEQIKAQEYIVTVQREQLDLVNSQLNAAKNTVSTLNKLTGFIKNDKIKEAFSELTRLDDVLMDDSARSLMSPAMLNRLEANRQKLLNQIKKAGGEGGDLLTKYLQGQGQVKNLEGAITPAQNALKAAEANLEALKKQLESVQLQKERDLKAFEELRTAELARLQASLMAAQERLDKLNKSQDTQIKATQKRLDQLQRQLDLVNRAKEDYNEIMDALADMAQRIVDKMRDALADFEQLGNAVSAGKNDVGKSLGKGGTGFGGVIGGESPLETIGSGGAGGWMGEIPIGKNTGGGFGLFGKGTKLGSGAAAGLEQYFRNIMPKAPQLGGTTSEGAKAPASQGMSSGSLIDSVNDYLAKEKARKEQEAQLLANASGKAPGLGGSFGQGAANVPTPANNNPAPNLGKEVAKGGGSAAGALGGGSAKSGGAVTPKAGGTRNVTVNINHPKAKDTQLYYNQARAMELD